jgi:hypothetical protein
MSLTQEIALTCPACDQDFTATIWASVSSSISPELKPKICDGTLNEVTCSECRFTIQIPGPILYHDMEKGLAFYVCLTASAQERVQAEKEARELLESQHKALANNARIYVLDSMSALGRLLNMLDSAENPDGTPLDFTKPEDWQGFVDIIVMPPLPWPLDHTCVCGVDIAIACLCEEPGMPVNISDYEPDIPPDLQIDCGKCGRSLVAFSCNTCRQSYHWSLGVVETADADIS